MAYALLALIPYTVFILSVRYANQRIDSRATTLLVNLLSFILPLIFVLLANDKPLKHAGANKYAWIIASLAGVGVGIYSLLIAKAYATTNVAIVTPILAGGAIILSSLGAYLIFGEKVTRLQLVGLLLVLSGLAVIGASRLKT